MTEENTNKLAINTLSNSGTSQNRKRVGRGIGSGTGKQQEGDIKVKNRDLAVMLGLALKADKCHYNSGSLSLIHI